MMRITEMEVLNRGFAYKCNEQWQIDLHDDYDHIDDSIEYVIENVLQSTNTQSASYHDLYKQFNSFIDRNCNCENEQNMCTAEECLHSGNYVIYEDEQMKHRELVLNEDRKSREIIYECSKFCSCHPYCYNRLVQFGPRKHLEITDLSHTGKQLGLVTLKSIPSGAFVCEYAGEILSKGEAIERHRANDVNQSMNYIICLNELPATGEANKTDAVIQTFIDPSRIGNIGRYLNHSCDPNCEIISVRIDGIIPKLCKNSVFAILPFHQNQNPIRNFLIFVSFSIGIFTKKSIPSNTELCFDYGEDESKLLPFTQTARRKACFCGTQKCRKYLPNL